MSIPLILLIVIIILIIIVLVLWLTDDEVPSKGKHFHELGTKDFDVTKYI